MSQRRLLVAASIIAAVVFLGFALSVPHTHDVIGTSAVQKSAPVVPAVTVHDAFKKGIHTISGFVEAPNACATVTMHSSLVGDATSTENILITLSLSQDSGVCLQVPTNISFGTSIAAPAHAPIRVTVNGEEASTTPS